MIRRNLTWDERLDLVEWYLDRIDLRTYKQSGDRAARDRIIAYLAGNGQPKEAIAQSFGISIGTVTKVLNRLQREHGVQVAVGEKGRDDTAAGGGRSAAEGHCGEGRAGTTRHF